MSRTWKDVEARWAREVGAALGFKEDTPVLGLSESIGYQGSSNVVVRSKKNEIVVYSWSYGSCSGCDGWEGNEQDIPGDVQAGARCMTVAAFKKYAREILFKPDDYHYSGASNHVAVAEAVKALAEEGG